MIKAVVQAIPSYIMSILQLPNTFCDSLTAAVAKFGWKSPCKNRCIHWRKFDYVCTPKGQCRLGFKDFKKMNTSFLTKQVRRMIQDPNCYWAKTLKGIYFPTVDFWHAKIGGNSSWVWKSLIHGRTLVKDEGRWGIGSGQNISIIEDYWLASGAKASLLPAATATIVSDLLNPSHEWDITTIRNNLTPQSAIETLKTPVMWTCSPNYLS